MLTFSSKHNITGKMARPKKNGPQIDWPAIYADWSTGQHTNQALSRKFGVSAMSIGRKAKNDGWTMTSGPVDNPGSIFVEEPTTPPEPKRKAAKTKAPKISDLLKQSTDIAHRLIAEVDNITTYQDEIRDIIIIEESDPLRRRAALKAISVTERTKTLKDLVATLKMIQTPAGAARAAKKTDDTEETPKGKKAQRQNEAEKAAQSGPFAVPSPPKLVVSK